ncbi:3-dehydroquinate synthase [Candidatus Bipolaricaulota bacterium]|nr:3-dehydroquinate synthase [Candidatus Bipolaricaulota bacterium]
MKTVDVDPGNTAYSILIDADSLSGFGEFVKERFGKIDGAVITDETVDRLYGGELADSLEAAGHDCGKLVVEPGEESKSPEAAKNLYRDLVHMELHRDSFILAFGGGVVGDLAGFVGSTFLRGIPVIQIPTTLLAQVDSSVGGKTAVDLPEGKNLVGTFYQPEAVFIDPVVLETLDPADVRSGLGEVLKYGLIWDEELFQKVNGNGDLFEDFNDQAELEGIISRCCEIKAEIVTEDERDRGIRQILNFGHTIGHGIEAGAGYGEMKHGEAVLWGMIGESWISARRGYLSQESLEEIVSALRGFALPPLPADLSEERLLKYVKLDKKVRRERINSVLLERIGGEAIVKEISESEVTAAWDYLTELGEG